MVQTPENTTKTYCLCRSSGEREMVACDSCDNWYHPSCVNLKRLPVRKYGTVHNVVNVRENKMILKNIILIYIYIYICLLIYTEVFWD